jgi:hypothetical protein
LPARQYRFQLANGPDPDMTFLMSDADEVSEAAVLALAETIFVEFSKTAELLSDKQKITQVEKPLAITRKPLAMIKNPLASVKTLPKKWLFFPNTRQKSSN